MLINLFKIIRSLIYIILAIYIQHLYNITFNLSGGGIAAVSIVFFFNLDSRLSLFGNVKKRNNLKKSIIARVKYILYFTISILAQHLYNIICVDMFGVPFSGGGISVLFYFGLIELDEHLSFGGVTDVKLTMKQHIYKKSKIILYLILSLTVQHLYNYFTFLNNDVLSGGGIAVLVYKFIFKLDSKIELMMPGLENNKDVHNDALTVVKLIIYLIIGLIVQHLFNVYTHTSGGSIGLLIFILLLQIDPYIRIIDNKPSNVELLDTSSKIMIKIRLVLYVFFAICLQYFYNNLGISIIGDNISGGGFCAMTYGLIFRIESSLISLRINNG